MAVEIKGFIETSLIDWEGKIVSDIFLPYCNFRCKYCHNHQLVFSPEKFDTIPLDDVLENLRQHREWLDGVCVTGGEPTIHHDLPELLRAIKGLGLAIKLDTNGTNPSMVKRMIDEGLLDYVAMDLKAPLDERYEKVAGVPVNLDKIRESIKLLMGRGIGYEFRTTVVPTLLDKEDMVDIAKSISGAMSLVLQRFNPKDALDTELREVKPYEDGQMEEMVEACRVYVSNCRYVGR